MKIGAVLNPNRSILKQLEECSGMDLDFVEVIADGNETGPEVLRRKRGELREALDRYSLEIYLHLPWKLDIGNPHGESRKGAVRTLKHILEIGKELGAKKAIMHPDSRSHDYWSIEEIRDNIISSLKELETSIKDGGPELVAENVRIFGLDNFDRVFEDTEVEMCLDTGHAYLAGSDEEEIAKFVDRHKDRVSHFHLNDNRGEYDEHLSLGYGFIDLKSILKELQKIKWKGSLSMELFTEDPDYLEMSRKKVGEWLGD